MSRVTRGAIGATLVACLLGCRGSAAPQPVVAAPAPPAEITASTTFTLTHLDGRAVPTPFRDPRGTYSLTAGELRLEPDGRLWFFLDLAGTTEFSSGPSGRTTLLTSYRRIGADSLVFPADSTTVPEFFGHFRGTQLIVVARPAQGPKAGVARDRGGVHTWVFVAR